MRWSLCQLVCLGLHSHEHLFGDGVAGETALSSDPDPPRNSPGSLQAAGFAEQQFLPPEWGSDVNLRVVVRTK